MEMGMPKYLYRSASALVELMFMKLQSSKTLPEVGWRGVLRLRNGSMIHPSREDFFDQSIH